MKIFISQMMKGKTDAEILDERARIIIKLEKLMPEEQLEILDSFFSGYNGSAIQFLGKSLQLMGEADLAVFAPGWENARGCRIEQSVASTYGLKQCFISVDECISL